MCKRVVLIVIGFMLFWGAAFQLSAQEKSSPRAKRHDDQAVKYEAAEGLPKNRTAEKLRDYAVLEACLNDLASPKNPEYKYHIKNVGYGREIVIDDGTCTYALLIDLDEPSHNIDNQDVRNIPAEIQKDFKRRNGERARSLADFKPANKNIIVRDLDGLFEKTDDPVGAFMRRYPRAWGYVWAYAPGYSRDGNSAVVVFEGGPNGIRSELGLHAHQEGEQMGDPVAALSSSGVVRARCSWRVSRGLRSRRFILMATVEDAEEKPGIIGVPMQVDRQDLGWVKVYWVVKYASWFAFPAHGGVRS